MSIRSHRRKARRARKERVTKGFIPPATKEELLEKAREAKRHIIGIEGQLASASFKNGFSDEQSYKRWRYTALLSLAGLRRELALLRVSSTFPEIKIRFNKFKFTFPIEDASTFTKKDLKEGSATSLMFERFCPSIEINYF